MIKYNPNYPLSLYIHIPFCTRKCDYCAFYSIVYDNTTIDRYYHLLIGELSSIVEEVKSPFYTIYIGGGNPALLGKERLKSILLLAQKYGKSKEVTIEFNPENISDDLITLYPLFTRLSVGIQALDDKTLTTIGRNARRKDNIRALEILSSSHIPFNVDLISCVPCDEKNRIINDIHEVIKYNPSHISLYSLTFEEGAELTSRLKPLCEEEERKELLSSWKELKSLGYNHYEISSFSKGKENESLHNKVYWSLGQYIGLGPSAESLLGYNNPISMRNTESLEEYLKDPSFQCYNLNLKEVEEEYLIVKLRTKYGINKEEYKSRFNKDFDTFYKSRIEKLKKGIYVNNNKRFYLNEQGMLLLDSVILTLALEL